jgi:hypothetical protein
MEIIIKLNSGRVVRASLPPGSVVSSDQLAVLSRWAAAGKPAPEIMVD